MKSLFLTHPVVHDGHVVLPVDDLCDVHDLVCQHLPHALLPGGGGRGVGGGGVLRGGL